MRLNKEELAMGAVFGLSLIGFAGWWSILAAAVCSVLWALGGSKNKLWRRCGCAVVVQITAMSLGVPILVHALMFWAVFGCLSIGYGIPSFMPAPVDSGSWLGQRVFKVVHDEIIASVLVRGIIGGLLAICLLPMLWVSVLAWVWASLILVLGMPAAFLFVEGDIDV